MDSDYSDGVWVIGNIRFRTRPEAQARNTPYLLSTGNMRGVNYRTAVAEAAVRYGPLFIQAETFQSHVNRTDANNVQFHGHYGQIAYVLTGEARQYDFKNGSFGKVGSSASGKS